MTSVRRTCGKTQCRPTSRSDISPQSARYWRALLTRSARASRLDKIIVPRGTPLPLNPRHAICKLGATIASCAACAARSPCPHAWTWPACVSLRAGEERGDVRGEAAGCATTRNISQVGPAASLLMFRTAAGESAAAALRLLLRFHMVLRHKAAASTRRGRLPPPLGTLQKSATMAQDCHARRLQ